MIANYTDTGQGGNVYRDGFFLIIIIMNTLSKTKLCLLNKTKQNDEFIARLLTCKLGNSRQ